MLTLLTLPPEIQLMIVGCIDDPGLLTLNLTCRAMRETLKPVIAATFAADRTFQLSIPGMTALLRLSMDAFNASYLKTLILVHSGRQQPAACYKLLNKALQNLGSFGRLRSIGIRHADDGVNFEPDKQQAHRCIRHFLEETLLKLALQAELPINNIILEIGIGQDVGFLGVNRRSWSQSAFARGEFVREFNEIITTLRALSVTSLPGAKHTFRMVREGAEGTRHSTSVMYDPQAQSLYGFRLLADDWLLLQGWITTPTRLKAITLMNCDIEYSTFCQLAINPLLESLAVKHAILYRSG